MANFEKQPGNRTAVQEIADKYDLSLREACDYIDVIDLNNALKAIDDPAVKFILDKVLRRFELLKVHPQIVKYALRSK